jgi:hypothetical protein
VRILYRANRTIEKLLNLGINSDKFTGSEGYINCSALIVIKNVLDKLESFFYQRYKNIPGSLTMRVINPVL